MTRDDPIRSVYSHIDYCRLCMCIIQTLRVLDKATQKKKLHLVQLLWSKVPKYQKIFTIKVNLHLRKSRRVSFVIFAISVGIVKPK